MSGTDVDQESTVATVQDLPDIDRAAAPGRRLSPKTRRAVPIALAVLVGASATAVALLGWQAIRAGEVEQDSVAALDAARTGTSQVFSYESSTLDADLARARANLAEPFATQFAELVSSVIVPTSQQQTVANRAEIVRSALVDAQPGRAEVLLVLRRTSSTAAQPQPQLEVVEVKVAMTRNADGQWLIADLQLV